MYKLTLFLKHGCKLEQVYSNMRELQIDHLYYMNNIDTILKYEIIQIKGEI